MAIFGKKKTDEVGEVQLDLSRLPKHIAIILDGNGRWAKKRGLPRTAGHKVGAEAFRTMAYHCRDLGIPYLTVYAFSTENWKRPMEEVSAIMGLLRDYLLEALEKMERDGFRIHFLGDISALTPELQQLCMKTESTARAVNAKYQINVCLNYGGRNEILRAAKRWAQDCAEGRANPEDLSEAVFSGYLDTRGIPDPDLIIRPGGELRMSNYLPWQGAYSEFYFTDVLWPDFGPEEMDRALVEFQGRKRRYGGV